MANKLCAFTRFLKPPTLNVCNGNRFRTEYSESLDSDGIKIVLPSGKTDMQAYIDSFKDDCDIYKILDRLSIAECSPDVVVEAMRQFRPDMFTEGSYGDFSNMPKNIHEVSKFYRDSVSFFNNLPVEIRKDYHYSVDEFFADFDNFAKKYSSVDSVKNASVSDSVKEVDSNE